jgi:hypothetical protein
MRPFAFAAALGHLGQWKLKGVTSKSGIIMNNLQCSSFFSGVPQ